jgi:tRNA(Ile)-lysidine synthase
MTGPAPSVARVRSAVRATLVDLPEGALVLAAVSGGRDSLALGDALAFESPRAGVRAGALVVDHGLQAGSAAVAEETAQVVQSLGLDPVHVLAVRVDREGGPEAAAREARYDALQKAAADHGALVVLLGHTLDDQAETVLLGLARGSGSRSLSGMPAERGIFRRPLLSIDRATTGAACAAAGLEPWDDPHNVDPAFTRVRVRHEVLPVLERELGPGVARALARTAAQLADDDQALEHWADRVLLESVQALEISCERLAVEPAAVRRRVIRQTALAAGVPGHALRATQLADLDALVARWRGQGPVDLPGGVRAQRTCGRLTFVSHGDATETIASQGPKE